MKTILSISTAAVILFAVPSPCFALWESVRVSKETAKQLGMEVRSTTAAPNHLVVELEFKNEGSLKEFSRVDLQFGEGDNPPLTAALREDRSKKGHVVVSFTADRGQLDKITLLVLVPAPLGGAVYEVQLNDFIETKKNR